MSTILRIALNVYRADAVAAEGAASPQVVVTSEVAASPQRPEFEEKKSVALSSGKEMFPKAVMVCLQHPPLPT